MAADLPPAPAPAVLASPAVQSAKASRAAMLAVTRAGSRLVAVGERGIVQLSDDHGATWRQAQTPVQVSLTAAHFVDARLGWAVGHLGVILHTQDGGEHWTLQLDGIRAAQLHAQALLHARPGDEPAAAEARRWIEEGPDKPFFDVSFRDARNGIVVGAFNSAFATEDGGATWHSVSGRFPNPKLMHLYAVRSRGEKAYAAGEQGLLFQSDDGGRTFQALPSPYKGSFFGLVLTRADTVLAFGLRGRVFRSTDAGQHWQAVQSGVTGAIAAAVELPGSRLALLSQDGRVWLSDDDGQTFRPSGAGVDVPAPGLVGADDGSLVVATLRGIRKLPAP